MHWLIETLNRWWFIESRILDPLAHWFSGSLLHWFTDSLVRWFIDPLGRSIIDSLIHWQVASLAHWAVEPLNHWFIDLLLHCFIDPLNSFTDSLMHWALVHRFIASFMLFFSDSSMSPHWHLNNHVFIRWCTSQLQHFIQSASQNLSYRPLIFHGHVLFLKFPPRRVPGTTWYVYVYIYIFIYFYTYIYIKK